MCVLIFMEYLIECVLTLHGIVERLVKDFYEFIFEGNEVVLSLNFA